MTTDLNMLRRHLETERRRLLGLKTDFHPDETSKSREDGEMATESLELEKRLALEKRTRDLLAEVEQALHKFGLGTYGLCEACGQPIEPARLKALPQAKLCLSCKASEGESKHMKNRSLSSLQVEGY